MVPTLPRGLRHASPTFSAAPSSVPHAGVLAPASVCPFPHPSSHSRGKREGALPTVNPHRWPTSAMRWGRGAWARQVWERGAGARHCAPRSSPPRALPHTHPGADSGQRALSLASISRWSGSFTSGARGSRLRGPPLPPLPPRLCAPLPGAPPRPRPARASLLPQLPGAGSLAGLAAAAATLPDPTLLLARARAAAAGGVGREGRKRGQEEGPGGVGRSLASPPSFLYTLREAESGSRGSSRGLGA